MAVFSSKAQMSIDWVNNFCCFDSIAPHTFSSPLGFVTDGDTLIIAYWQDDVCEFKKINLPSGTDYPLSYFHYAVDSFMDPKYFGGDFLKINGRYYVAGIDARFHNYHYLNYGPVFDLRLAAGSAQTGIRKISKSARSTASGSVICAELGDTMIGIVMANIFTGFDTTSFAPKNQTTNLYPDVFEIPSQKIAVFSDNLPGAFTTFIRLISCTSDSGFITLDQSFSSTTGNSHQFAQMGDTLVCAFTDSSTFETIFQKIDLNNFQSEPIVQSSVFDIYGVRKLSISPDSQFIYVRTGTTFSKFTRDFQLIYSRTIPGSSFDAENRSSILFDDDQNPILGYSFINNLLTNEDVLILIIDKNSGVTLDSLHYNDARNTADHLLNMFRDSTGNLNVIFCNDYDNFAILAEETQIGIFQISSQSLSSYSLSAFDKSIRIFPIPASNSINVSGIADEFEYTILNNLGQVIQQGHSINRNELSISSLQPGYYFLKLIAKKGVGGKGFIKQ